jgi:hypothetical protein
MNKMTDPVITTTKYKPKTKTVYELLEDVTLDLWGGPKIYPKGERFATPYICEGHGTYTPLPKDKLATVYVETTRTLIVETRELKVIP